MNNSGYLDKILKNKPEGASPEPTGVPVENNVVSLPVVEHPAPPVVGAPGKVVYAPFGLHQVKKRYSGRIRFYYSKNNLGQSPVGVMSYNYLTEIFASSDRFISMIFTNVVITLEGRNLSPLLELLEEDKVHWVLCFDPDRHIPPAEGETSITNISRESLAQFMSGGKQRA